jgi:hypothetical protein
MLVSGFRRSGNVIMSLRPLLVRSLVGGAVGGVVAGAALPAASGEIERFGRWIAACDNLRACNAYAFDAHGDPGRSYIRLERGGGADAALRITLVAEAETGVTFTLAFDRPALAGLPAGPLTGEVRGDDGKTRRLSLVEPQAAASALASMRKAETIVITRIDPPGAPPSDPARTEISLAGLDAALRWIDTQQKRVDTVTALVGRGDKPATAVPAAPAPPVVVAARATGPVPHETPADVVAEAGAVCADRRLGAAGEVVRLGENDVVYAFDCELGGAYNAFNALIVATPGRPPRRADFVFPPEYAAAAARLWPIGGEFWPVNASFDAATQTMSTVIWGRGLGDCGFATDWVWDGQAFRLIRSQDMPDCRGVAQDDWPILWRAERK